MLYEGDSRRRTVLILGATVLIFFAFLGALQAFNTSHIPFLNPETSGETLALFSCRFSSSCFCCCARS
jgi:two-component system nitrogen regulation sensor histidine kinase NtrY